MLLAKYFKYNPTISSNYSTMFICLLLTESEHKKKTVCYQVIFCVNENGDTVLWSQF